MRMEDVGVGVVGLLYGRKQSCRVGIVFCFIDSPKRVAEDPWRGTPPTLSLYMRFTQAACIIRLLCLTESSASSRLGAIFCTVTARRHASSCQLAPHWVISNNHAVNYEVHRAGRQGRMQQHLVSRPWLYDINTNNSLLGLHLSDLSDSLYEFSRLVYYSFTIISIIIPY
jgi:hypothetical protein